MLQIEFTKVPSLPPRLEQTQSAQEERVLARTFSSILIARYIITSDCCFHLSSGDVYESAVLFTSSRGDDAGFDRNFALLMPYYLELRGMIPGSSNEALVWGLRLLMLLVQNRIAEFHATVELLPRDMILTPEVSQVMELEGWMMQGSYAKVGAAQSSAISPYYVPLLQRIVTTVRNEVASCSQAAYKKLRVQDLPGILGIHPNEIDAAVAEYGWRKEGEYVILQEEDAEAVRGLPEAEQVIENCLQYAKELERIL